MTSLEVRMCTLGNGGVGQYLSVYKSWLGQGTV